MRRVVSVVTQIEQALSLLQQGGELRSRMAFVLLDNAAEILMYRRIKDHLQRDDMYRRMFDRVRRAPKKKAKEFLAQHELPVLSRERRRKIERHFSAKANYLSEDTGELPVVIAKALVLLHEHRNAIFHRDEVRTDLVREAGIVLFELTCDLLVYLKPGSYVLYGSSDTVAERFCERYELSAYWIPDDSMERIRDKLRSQLTITPYRFTGTLQEHLRKRIRSTEEKLDFIRSDGMSQNSSRNDAIRLVEFVDSSEPSRPIKFEEELTAFEPKVSIYDFARWKCEILALRRITNKYEMLVRFAEIEDEFENIERPANQAATDLDQAIQLAIDQARGK